MNTDKPTLDQVITYLTHRLDGMTMPGAVRMTTAARDYLVELQAENEKLRAKLKQVKRERDSALKDLERLCRDDVGPCEMAICELCAYNSGVQCSSSDRQICDGYNVFNWKWRGQKED